MRRPQVGEMAVSLTGSPLLVGSVTCEEVPTVNVPLLDGRVTFYSLHTRILAMHTILLSTVIITILSSMVISYHIKHIDHAVL